MIEKERKNISLFLNYLVSYLYFELRKEKSRFFFLGEMNEIESNTKLKFE